MVRIKVTGYIDSENLNVDDLDETSPTGLSEKGYEYVTAMSGEGDTYAIGDLEDIVIRRVTG